MPTDAARRRARLEARLHDAWRNIDRAIAENRNVDDWERLWVRLLAEYETLDEQIRIAEHAAEHAVALRAAEVRAEGARAMEREESRA